ncbi:MAG: hypothetical protein IMZ63_02065 [Actinobacteria bacterium]|nr:hypothetical protein [Actinomycetota bacterium]
MPHITINDIQDIQADNPGYGNIKVFIETGTHFGQTIFKINSYFDKIHTIEIKEDIYNTVVNMAHTKESHPGSFQNINFHLGDSTYLLPKILKNINEPCVFFLDGHYSHGITGRGEKDTPLLEEVKAIEEFHNQSSIIIIDDCGMFGKHDSEDDWSQITESNILNSFSRGKISKYYTTGIRFIILLQKV